MENRSVRLSGGQVDNKRNHMLNILKGIGCIGVVFMHVSFPDKFGEIIVELAQFAVPIFLMISGYFAFDANNNAGAKIIRRTKKIVKLTLVSMLFYLLYAVVIRFSAHSIGEWIGQLLDIKTWINLFLLNDLDIINGGHLWFLPALVYVYLILYFIDKYNLYKLAYKILPFLFLLRLAVVIITVSFDMTWHFRSNFITSALPYLLMGNYIASHKSFQTKFSNKFLILSAIIGAGFSVVCLILDFAVDVSEVGIIVYAVSLFMLAVKNPQVSFSKKIEALGDKYSLYVYVIHIAINGLLSFVVKKVGIDDAVWFMWSRPIIVAVIAVIVSVVLFKVMNLFKNKKAA